MIMPRFSCRSCKSQMFGYRMPQICDHCLNKGGSGADPDLNSRVDHEYGDFYPDFDAEVY